MLKKPKDGWSKITIGNWSDRCSYINNVPIDLLKAFINLYKYRNPTTVKFDAEGWEYIIVFDFYEIHIITEKNDEYILKTIPCNINNLTNELVNDILLNIKEWVNFDEDSPLDKTQIIDLCNRLKNERRKFNVHIY